MSRAYANIDLGQRTTLIKMEEIPWGNGHCPHCDKAMVFNPNEAEEIGQINLKASVAKTFNFKCWSCEGELQTQIIILNH